MKRDEILALLPARAADRCEFREGGRVCILKRSHEGHEHELETIEWIQRRELVSSSADRCEHTEPAGRCSLQRGHHHEHLPAPELVLERLDELEQRSRLSSEANTMLHARWSARFVGLPPHELARDIPAELAAARAVIAREEGAPADASAVLSGAEERAPFPARAPIWAFYADTAGARIREESAVLRAEIEAYGVEPSGWQEGEPPLSAAAAELEQLLEQIDRLDGDSIWRFYADKQIASALAERERLRRQLDALDRS